MSNTVFVKLTAAIVVGGEVVRPPAIVELTHSEARDLLNRGKGVTATERDGPVSARTMGAEAVLNPEVAAFNKDAEDIRADNAEPEPEPVALVSPFVEPEPEAKAEATKTSNTRRRN
ncbi:MAG TPA: hypothetical protein VJM50_23825 [Pyrinomonadaceae bacterium]|nr:hypothetical protein [Pyrinomonadaceae bacterium]